MSTDYSLQNLSSLDVADISRTSVLKNEDAPPELELHVGVKELFDKRTIQFLRAVHNVKDLGLSYFSLEVLPFQRKCSMFINSLNAITYLLKITPNVESIVIHTTQYYIARPKGKLYHNPAVCPYVDQ
ncbi:hypothetical protein MKW92_031511, partial [Papaver armeniacum]